MKYNFSKIIKTVLAAMVICFAGTIKAQGVDVILWLDNSSSIDNTEWTNLSNSTKSLIDEVLACNTNNRVAVVHYGSQNTSSTSSLIYIESNFTNNATTAKSFVRRGGASTPADHAHEALAIIGNALDGIANASIASPQTTLTRNTNNKLVIFLFTDANRGAASSALVNSVTPAAPFANYNTFKSSRGADFVVAISPSGSGVAADDLAAAAAAAIASVGGSYNGNVEANAGDPQGSGVKPRKMVRKTDFTLTTGERTQLKNDICRSCTPSVSLAPSTPATQTVCQNAAAQSLAATATGSGTLSYQWYSNATNSTTGGTAIAGATSATYTPSTAAAGTLYYYVIVTASDCDGTATSSIVSVTVSNTGACNPCTVTNTAPVIGL